MIQFLGLKLKVTERAKLLGVPGRYLKAGDIVVEVEPADDDGLVTVRNDLGEQGAVKSSCLGKIISVPAYGKSYLFY